VEGVCWLNRFLTLLSPYSDLQRPSRADYMSKEGGIRFIRR